MFNAKRLTSKTVDLSREDRLALGFAILKEMERIPVNCSDWERLDTLYKKICED